MDGDRSTWRAPSTWMARGRRLLLFLRLLWREIVDNRLIIRASGLAYTTLLSVVPLTAVVFALFTAFAAFDEVRSKIQDFLLQKLLPSGQEQVMAYIDKFTRNSSNLGFAGFVLLIVTAILLLDNIDWNFNEMWHVKSRRSFLNRVMAYTSVMVFGTMLIGVSVAISSRLESALFSGTPFERLRYLAHLGSLLFPLVSSFLAFLIMYIVIPATRVRFGSAALGAAFTAVTWEIGKALFANSVGQSVRYSTIYGSLAAVPIFLIWLYLTWGLILIGLDIAYVHQNFAGLVRLRSSGEPTVRQRLAVAVELFARVAGCFDRGDRPPDMAELAEAMEVPDSAVRVAVDTLEREGLVRWSADREGDDHGLVPARPLERIRVRDVLGAAFGADEGAAADRQRPAAAADAVVRRFEEAGRTAVGDLGFLELAAGSGDHFDRANG